MKENQQSKIENWEEELKKLLNDPRTGLKESMEKEMTVKDLPLKERKRIFWTFVLFFVLSFFVGLSLGLVFGFISS